MIKSFIVLLLSLVMKSLMYDFTEQEKYHNDHFKQSLKAYEEKMESKKDKKVVSEAFLNYKHRIKELIVSRAVLPKQYYKVLHRSKKRTIKNILNHKQQSFAELKREFPPKDLPKRFFNDKFETNIVNLPLVGQAEKKPWSGTYWPMQNGLASVRYQRNSRNSIGTIDPNSYDFLYKYTYNQSVAMYIQPNDYQNARRSQRSNLEKFINENYSPSEKYDLLVGDLSFTLTKNQKRSGLEHLKEHNGDIPSWFGICHGWAPAAYHFDRPKKSLILTARNGLKLKFFPDDIKALASLFIANANTNTNFIGDICRVTKPKVPKSDPRTGLYLEAICHAINPGSFIITIGNQVGINKKNLVYDPKADDEVWNHPVSNYKMRYFNLLTGQFDYDPLRVKIPIKNIKRSTDKFLNFIGRMASRKADSVVGVFINITYGVETQPNFDDQDFKDANKTSGFEAAVELDSNNNIVGGEWKYNEHPNFIWKLDENLPIEGCCDRMIKNEFNGRVDEDMTYWARAASSKGQVLRTVIDYMVKESSKNMTERPLTREEELENRWGFLFD
jgi:hypothetical protein